MDRPDDLIRDRIAHAIVFCEATLRALRDALELVDKNTGRKPAGEKGGQR